MPTTVGEARNEFWARVGTVSPDVIAPFINPAFMGYPAWPDLRQAFRVITGHNGNTILATDGLSDPFMEGHLMAPEGVSAVSGFRLELYIETDEPITIGAGGAGSLWPRWMRTSSASTISVAKAVKSWQFAMLNQMALNTADTGEFREGLDRYGQISIELYNVPLPQSFLLDAGGVGSLIGPRSKLVPGSFDGPAGNVAVASVMLLHPSELHECRTPAGRRKVADAIFERWGEPLSSLSRPPVI